MSQIKKHHFNIKLFKNGKEVNIFELFNKAERILNNNSDFYSKTLFPLTNMYTPDNPNEASFLSLGILIGIIMEKEKYKIIPSDKMEFNDVIFRYLTKVFQEKNQKRNF